MSQRDQVNQKLRRKYTLQQDLIQFVGAHLLLNRDRLIEEFNDKKKKKFKRSNDDSDEVRDLKKYLYTSFLLLVGNRNLLKWEVVLKCCWLFRSH